MTRDDINKLFDGRLSSNGNLKYMGEFWTIQDMIDYLEATGYKANAAEVIGWLRKFYEDNK